MTHWINAGLFPKDCELTYPEKVPFIRDFSHNDLHAVIGSATVTRDEKGLICDVELVNFDRDILQNEFNDELYISGYYKNVKRLVTDDKIIVEKAVLVEISTVLFGPDHEEMKIRVVEEG